MTSKKKLAPVINIPGLKRKDQIINSLNETINEIECLAVCYIKKDKDGDNIAYSEYSPNMDIFKGVPDIDHAIYMLNVLKHRLITNE